MIHRPPLYVKKKVRARLIKESGSCFGKIKNGRINKYNFLLQLYQLPGMVPA